MAEAAGLSATSHHVAGGLSHVSIASAAAGRLGRFHWFAGNLSKNLEDLGLPGRRSHSNGWSGHLEILLLVDY